MTAIQMIWNMVHIGDEIKEMSRHIHDTYGEDGKVALMHLLTMTNAWANVIDAMEKFVVKENEPPAGEFVPEAPVDGTAP